MFRTLLLLALLATSAMAQTNLIRNGDFEDASPASPPPGWAMWGPEESKIPANYSRDPDHPHGGRASVRIVHPKNSAGYLVTAPGDAIHAQMGQTYELGFFARADKPCKTVVGIGAYEKTDPFVDAPSPGFWTIDLTADWKPFHFTVREGVDFDAAVSKLLMPSFKATPDFAAERTMWLDDVSVVASPNPPGLPKLVNESTLRYASVDPVLTRGDSLKVTIDPGRSIGEASRMAMGVSFHRVTGWTQMPYNADGKYTLPESLESAIADLQLPMTRFYGVGDEPRGVEWAIDRVADICRKAKIPNDRVVLELENLYAQTSLEPAVWARAAKYSDRKHYGFHHWEVGNEVYTSLFGGGGAFADPDHYIAHLKAVTAAVRAVQPTARLGVSINAEQRTWGNYMLASSAGSYDFVVPHFYAGGDAFHQPFEDLVIGLNTRTLDRAARLNALIAAYNPGRAVTILDTEWATYFTTPDGRDPDYNLRNANIINVCHRAVRMIYYTRQHLVEAASGWQMLSKQESPGFGVLLSDAPNQRTLLYWLYYHCNRTVGPRLLPMTGTAPWFESTEANSAAPLTPMLVTGSADGKTVQVMVVNGSWTKAVPMDLALPGFAARSAAGIALSQDRLDSNPILPDAKDPAMPLAMAIKDDHVSATLPPHSVVFMTLTK